MIHNNSASSSASGVRRQPARICAPSDLIPPARLCHKVAHAASPEKNATAAAPSPATYAPHVVAAGAPASGTPCHATELYDEVNDPHETVNVATKAEHAEVIARLTKFLPPPIAPATAKNAQTKVVSKKGKPKWKAPAAPAPKAGATEDRGAMFDGHDINKDGKLNKEEFMLRQSDPESAAKNFVKFDKDKSGDVNRDEYVNSGK